MAGRRLQYRVEFQELRQKVGEETPAERVHRLQEMEEETLMK